MKTLWNFSVNDDWRGAICEHRWLIEIKPKHFVRGHRPSIHTWKGLNKDREIAKNIKNDLNS